MARKFLDYNPITGLMTTHAEEDGKVITSYEQDVSASLDFASTLRKERTVDKVTSEHAINHVAFVPDVVILKMLTEDGVNFYDKNQSKRVMQLLETKYPACKTTDKRIA